MGIKDQDHVLVVAGRVSGSLDAYKSWDSDAVVCDPWAKRAYFVYALEDEMALLKSVANGETKMGQKFRLAANGAWN